MTRTLNIGILAHVDAGKTSLTERLLFDAGAIDRLGSVDAGSTQTDTNEIERSRGITIRSAVASFRAGDVQVNLIDTPGHSDFIAEVERALSVLDGAVLVLSAVEGVQPQTRILMRTLRKLGLPVLLFVNKIDRMGAREDGLLADIREKLTPRLLPLSAVRDIGTRAATTVPHRFGDPGARTRITEALADQDDALLAEYLDGMLPEADDLRKAVATQTGDGVLHPVYFGSALSGQGVPELVEGIRRFLPAAVPSPSRHPRGTVFAIERARNGEKVAYLRLRSGVLTPRQAFTVHRRDLDGTLAEYAGQATAVEVIGAEPGPDAQRLTAGGIAKIRGLPGVRVGDRIGDRIGSTPGPAGQPDEQPHFPPPSLETLVRPVDPAQLGALHAALLNLADRDPLIRTRTEAGGGTSVLLYGEVQKEVIGTTLAAEFGIDAEFEASRTVHLERPIGTGEARITVDRRTPNDFIAGVGLRVEPGAPGSGIVYRRESEYGALPVSFHRAIEETVHHTLEQGLYGWAVTDCTVTLTMSEWFAPVTSAGDFRNLTPMVLLRALDEAGSRVHEPCHAYELEIPADSLNAVLGRLAAIHGEPGSSGPGQAAGAWNLAGSVPARHVHRFTQQLPGLTHGEGTWFSHPSGDRALAGGKPPTRPRTDGNPLDRVEYLRHLSRREVS